jgi:FKBP-type peptidyl-prolyl cis-trans isomerase
MDKNNRLPLFEQWEEEAGDSLDLSQDGFLSLEDPYDDTDFDMEVDTYERNCDEEENEFMQPDMEDPDDESSPENDFDNEFPADGFDDESVESDGMDVQVPISELRFAAKAGKAAGKAAKKALDKRKDRKKDKNIERDKKARAQKEKERREAIKRKDARRKKDQKAKDQKRRDKEKAKAWDQKRKEKKKADRQKRKDARKKKKANEGVNYLIDNLSYSDKQVGVDAMLSELGMRLSPSSPEYSTLCDAMSMLDITVDHPTVMIDYDMAYTDFVDEASEILHTPKDEIEDAIQVGVDALYAAGLLDGVIHEEKKDKKDGDFDWKAKAKEEEEKEKKEKDKKASNESLLIRGSKTIV